MTSAECGSSVQAAFGFRDEGQATIVDRLKAYASQRDFRTCFAGPPGTGKTTAALSLRMYSKTGIYSRNL